MIILLSLRLKRLFMKSIVWFNSLNDEFNCSMHCFFFFYLHLLLFIYSLHLILNGSIIVSLNHMLVLSFVSLTLSHPSRLCSLIDCLVVIPSLFNFGWMLWLFKLWLVYLKEILLFSYLSLIYFFVFIFLFFDVSFYIFSFL